MNEQRCPNKQPVQRYRIGMFAQMNKVTIKTLRHYDEIGLLSPAYVDEHNGYRYYTAAQLPVLHRILALREIGFHLEEIAMIKDETTAQKDLLRKKKSELLQQMSELTKQIADIERCLSNDQTIGEYRVVLKELPAVIIASMRVHLQGYDDLFSYMPKMGRLMEKAGCTCADPDYCFTMYVDHEDESEAEICQAVTEKGEDGEQLHFTKLPLVTTAVCVLHKGSYETLPRAYRVVAEYMEEHGYLCDGAPREVYIDGIWNKEEEADWLTELQFPVQTQE